MDDLNSFDVPIDSDFFGIDESKKSCFWVLNSDPDYSYYSTSCGEDFIFEDGSPKDNRYNFCPNCGKKLIYS